MRPRNPLDVVADYLAVPEHDRIIRNTIGLVASAALIVLYIAMRITPSKIGA